MARFWSPEVEAGEDLARELIAAQFPELAPVELQPYGAGMDNAAYLVNGRFIFRFPRREIAVPLLEREARILPLLVQQVPVPIPHPRFVGAPRGAFPWMFAGYERIAGTPACSVTLSDDDRRALAPQLGAFLRALHSVEPSPLIASGLPGDELGRLDHARRLPLARERFAILEDAGAISRTEPFIALLEHIAPSEADKRAVVVHGDLYARHVLVGEDRRLSGIIDWGDLHLGHPALDLTIAHSMLPPDAHASFIDAYGGVDTRTWALAKYRATYHSALVADFGLQIGDAALLDAGLTALRFIRETL